MYLWIVAKVVNLRLEFRDTVHDVQILGKADLYYQFLELVTYCVRRQQVVGILPVVIGTFHSRFQCLNYAIYELVLFYH